LRKKKDVLIPGEILTVSNLPGQQFFDNEPNQRKRKKCRAFSCVHGDFPKNYEKIVPLKKLFKLVIENYYKLINLE